MVVKPRRRSRRSTRLAGGLQTVAGRWTEVPKHPRPPKAAVRVVYAILGTTLVVSLGAFGTASATSRRIAQLAPHRDYRGFGQIVASDYLAGRRTALPAASGVGSSLGRNPVSVGSIVSAVNTSALSKLTKAQPITVHALAWAGAQHVTINGQGQVIDRYYADTNLGTFVVSVPLSITPKGHPFLGGLPSISAMPNAGRGASSAINYNNDFRQQFSLTGPENQQVAAWAQAFASDNSQQLYALTGDTAPATFVGIRGWKLLGHAVTSAAPGKTTVIAQVALVLQSRSNPSVIVTSSYDLLLGDLNHAVPSVVAWGPPGSGPTLRPLQNAL